MFVFSTAGLTIRSENIFCQLYTESFVLVYTEAKVDVTQEIEQRAQQTAQAGADHCALCSISCVTSTLASV